MQDNTYEIEIKKLDHQGRGIGKINNCVVFVPNSLPNEIVDIKINRIKKNYMEGTIVKIKKESCKRLKPICPYFDLCGGCDLMHISYVDQLQYKMDKIKDIFNKYLNTNINVKNIIETNPLFYRNKVTLKVNDKLGFYKKKSNDIIKIDSCFIVQEKINNIINILNKYNLKGKEIVIKKSFYTTDSMVIFEEDINEKMFNELKETITNIVVKGKTIYGNGYIIDNIDGLDFMISSNSFFQVNTYGAQLLYKEVLNYCDLKGNETILDLYCGTGTIGIYLSRYCKKVLGIELNESAIKDALKNKEINNIKNISFICGDVKDKIDSDSNFDVIVVDPPRSGLDSSIINDIIKISPQKIVYVSCDPMSLVRDLKLLNSNYDIVSVTPVDMFPNTYHVECVSVLHRKNFEK